MSEKHTLLEDLGPIAIQTLLEAIRPGAEHFITRTQTKRDSAKDEFKNTRQMLKGIPQNEYNNERRYLSPEARGIKSSSGGIGKYLLGLGAAGAGAGAYTLRDKLAGLLTGHHDDEA
jgi:hypothetical protein